MATLVFYEGTGDVTGLQDPCKWGRTIDLASGRVDRVGQYSPRSVIIVSIAAAINDMQSNTVQFYTSYRCAK